MKVKVRCIKLECLKDMHFETQPEPAAKNLHPESLKLALKLVLQLVLGSVDSQKAYLSDSRIYYTLF